eukprot:scaffold274875_cov40-Attheya_sp.AAC.1
METFDANIVKALGALAEGKDFTEELDVETPVGVPYDDDDNGAAVAVPDRDDIDPEAYDNYLSAEVLLPYGDKMVSGKVVGRKRELDGSLKGKS